MSIFVLSPGISSSLSFDIGEKQVRTVFKSDLNLGQVVRPSTLPVIMAVFRPNFSFTKGPTLLYRYSAVSENAVKMIIFSFPGLIGAVILLLITRKSSRNFKSCSGVMSRTI